MEATTPIDNRYWAPVDPDAPNNSHAFALQLIGGNKRVLELGPAAGHFTEALVANGCRVVGIEVDPAAAERASAVAERVVIGDLSDPDVIASAIDEERFDVVVAGDVLEHLPDPLEVLRVCRNALKPGGFLVLSLPNVAHADVKLQLLHGRFPYSDTGLLDRTHLRLFTLDSIQEMLHDAGLVMVDLKRVRMPVFHTELAMDRGSVSPEALAAATADPESETYQFVVRVVPHDGGHELSVLGDRLASLEAQLERAESEREALSADLDAMRSEVADLRDQVATERERADAAERHVAAILATRSYRLMAPFRAVFARRG